MVEYKTEQLDGVFGALSDSTRRSILEHLRRGPATVGELAEPHDMTFQGVSKHLKKLEAAGLVRRRKEGREVWCELVVGPMRQASTWIDEQRRFWEVRLDRLGELLEERPRPDKGDQSHEGELPDKGDQSHEGDLPDNGDQPDEGERPDSGDLQNTGE